MALLRNLLYKKPPDGLVDVFERIYVFDSCFRIKTWEQEEYKAYVDDIISQFKETCPESSVMIFNFREGHTASNIHRILSQYFISIMDYPRHYEGCPLLPMEVIHHFLKSSETWLSLGQQNKNIVLMHCEVGGWPVLAFMLAALLLYRKHYTAANRALEMVYKRAPHDVSLQLMSPLNSAASQLRYLQYVLQRKDDEQWPPAAKALTLVCVMMRMNPDFDGKGGCCPIFRIYGRDPLLHLDKTSKLLFSTPRRSQNVRSYNQAEIELVKIDINFHIQGDIVLECLNLHDDVAKEDIMYRAMFNTAFIKSNTLVLNRDEIDVSWDIKDQFSKDFKAELFFSEVDATTSMVPVDLSCLEEEGLPMEASPAAPPPPHISDPPPPTLPASSANGNKEGGAAAPPLPPSSQGGGVAAPFPPPPVNKLHVLSKTTAVKSQPAKRLKPLNWLNLYRVGQGSLWAEAKKSGEAARAPKIDISELKTLFSASKAKSKATNTPKKIQLIDHTRAYNCEILLSKVKTPLPELMGYVLNLDDSALMDVDQVDNLIKCCPTREEMEIIKGYKGEPENLGKCEQFFLELMKVPRSEAKLIVYSYKLHFTTRVSDLRNSLNDLYLSEEQIRSSVKLRKVMLTILSLGNAFNHGTATGAAVGFRLDSLLRLNETRDRSNKMTLMHYLCKVLAHKLPELLDFSKELGCLEPASKIQLKILAEEMQAITKGLEKVVQEKKLCKKDGHVSKKFRKSLKKFLASAEPDVKTLAALYAGVGKSVDALIIYFGEDPSKCPYEKVVETLRSFVRMFNQAHDENCKQIDAEKKTAQEAAEQEKLKAAEPYKLEADE